MCAVYKRFVSRTKCKDAKWGSSRYKFFWQGSPKRVHGAGVLVSEEFLNNLVEVQRLSARPMIAKSEINKNLVNVISACSQQIRSSAQVKDNFWMLVMT